MHNVYRRIFEFVKKSNNFDKNQQIIISTAIKTSMRFPTTAMDTLQSNKELNIFVTKYVQYIIKYKPNNIPLFFQTIAIKIHTFLWSKYIK